MNRTFVYLSVFVAAFVCVAGNVPGQYSDDNDELYGRRVWDLIGRDHLLRHALYLDSLGDGVLLRRALDSIGGGPLLGRRALDSIGGGPLLGRRALDSIGGGPLLGRRALDSIGGGPLLGRRATDSNRGSRTLDKIGGGSLLGKRTFDSIDGGPLLENAAETELNMLPEKRARGLDTMAGISFGSMKKRRIDTLGGGSFGSQKRDGHVSGAVDLAEPLLQASQAKLRNFIIRNSEKNNWSDRQVPKKTTYPYYVQSIPIPLPMFLKIKDKGI